MKIILASQSPRRQKLLKKIVARFEIMPSDFDEAKVREKNPLKFVRQVAEAKAKLVAKKIKGQAIIVAADTIVVYKNRIIGKPKNNDDAFEILSALSGKRQRVITGFCLINTKNGKEIIGYEKSIVKMKKMSDRTIKNYVATAEGRDKAGAYAIQGRADKFIEYIKGDYYNVVGLPVTTIRKALRRIK